MRRFNRLLLACFVSVSVITLRTFGLSYQLHQSKNNEDNAYIDHRDLERKVTTSNHHYNHHDKGTNNNNNNNNKEDTTTVQVEEERANNVEEDRDNDNGYNKNSNNKNNNNIDYNKQRFVDSNHRLLLNKTRNKSRKLKDVVDVHYNNDATEGTNSTSATPVISLSSSTNNNIVAQEGKILAETIVKQQNNDNNNNNPKLSSQSVTQILENKELSKAEVSTNKEAQKGSNNSNNPPIITKPHDDVAPLDDKEGLATMKQQLQNKNGKKKNVKISHSIQNEEDVSSPLVLDDIVNNNNDKKELVTDPLGLETFQDMKLKQLVEEPQIEYLAVMVDAGRHYFPIDWLKRLIVILNKMRYNMTHLRLTDDQTFNVQLKSHPKLAYPSKTNNNTNRVYTADELHDLVLYAKRYNITIIPEINIPGHAGSWAGIDPELVVNCPNFICEKGYGVPLNVTHPKFFPILKDVLKEIIYDIFELPPFVHLGGDEVNMAQPCFDEVNEPMFDYHKFENKLKRTLKQIKYPEENVIRWEMSFHNHNRARNGRASSSSQLKNQDRAGKILHYWLTEAGERYDPPENGRYFISRHLYFDANGDDDAMNIYRRTRYNLIEYPSIYAYKPTAIVAGTFELSTQFWHDRNVLGRLLAVYLATTKKGLYDITLPSNYAMGDYKQNRKAKAIVTKRFKEQRLLSKKNKSNEKNNKNYSKKNLRNNNDQQQRDDNESVVVQDEFSEFNNTYYDICSTIGFSNDYCLLKGLPAIPTNTYKAKWSKDWVIWKADICQRYAIETHHRFFHSHYDARTQFAAVGKERFWDLFGTFESSEEAAKSKHNLTAIFEKYHHTTTKVIDDDSSNKKILQRKLQSSLLRKHRVGQKTGIVLDLVKSPKSVERIQTIIETIAKPLGIQMIQLRLISDHGWILDASNLMDGWGGNYAAYTPIADNLQWYEKYITASKEEQNKMNEQLLLDKDKGRNMFEVSQKSKNIYSPEMLQSIVDYAATCCGIEVIPEITISTNAGGWLNTGYVAPCGNLFCNTNNQYDNGSTGMALDIHNDNLMPTIFSLIQELRKIFTSTNYIHLGSDERQQAMQCFNETYAISKSLLDDDPYKKYRKNNNEQSKKKQQKDQPKTPNFALHEHKLDEVLRIMKIPSDHVIRYQNRENIIYNNRAGDVTNYYGDSSTTNTPSSKQQQQLIDTNGNNNQKGTKFFATVDLLSSNNNKVDNDNNNSNNSLMDDLWTIFMQTKEWVVSTNAAVMMADAHDIYERKWNSNFVSQRILAFVIGSSMKYINEINSKEQFETVYIEICQHVLSFVDEDECRGIIKINNNNSNEVVRGGVDDKKDINDKDGTANNENNTTISSNSTTTAAMTMTLTIPDKNHIKQYYFLDPMQSGYKEYREMQCQQSTYDQKNYVLKDIII